MPTDTDTEQPDEGGRTYPRQGDRAYVTFPHAHGPETGAYASTSDEEPA